MTPLLNTNVPACGFRWCLHSIIRSCRALKIPAGPLALLVAALLPAIGRMEAAVVTWTGGSSSGNWSAGANWDSGIAPANNDSLVFNAGIGAGAITNNLSGRTFAQISFIGAGAGFTIYGNPITLTGGISQSSTGGANTLHPDITLATNHQTFTVSGAGAGSGLTISGDINLNGRNLTVNVIDDGTELNLSGAISGTGNLARGTGAGGLRLSGGSANTYSGLTTISGGYLLAIKPNNVISIPGDVIVGNGLGVDQLILGTDHQLSATSAVTLHDGGVLDNNNETNAVGSLTFVDGGTVESTTGRLELGGPITVTGAGNSNAVIYGNLHLGPATRTFNIANTPQSVDLEINGVLSGGGSGGLPSIPAGLIKSGAGVLQLSAANTYGGQTIINEGQLTAAHDRALGATTAFLANAGTVVNSNGVLMLNDAHITNEVLTLNSTNLGGALQNTATADWVGDIVLSTNVRIEASSAFGLGGEISGAGGFTKIGLGTITMFGTNANTYTGATRVNSGALVLDRSTVNGTILGPLFVGDGVGGTNADVVVLAALNQIANTVRITITNSGLYDMDGYADAIGSLVGNGRVDLGSATMNIGFDNTTAVFDGTISGTGGLNKFTGTTGTQTLNGHNTYTGTTTINGGTLLVNGQQQQSSVVIGAAGTIGGNGRVGSIQNNGTISPGGSPGTLYCDDVAFGPGSAFNIEINGSSSFGAGFDSLIVFGTNLLDGTVHLSVGNGFSPAEGERFTILESGNFSSTTVGTFQGLPNNSVITNGIHQFHVRYNEGDSDNDVVLIYTNPPLDVISTQVISGNGNSVLDPSECNTIYLVVTNISGLPMTGVSAVLSANDLSLPSVVVTQPESAYPNIPVKGRGTNLIPFQVSTLPSFVCGDEVELKLTLKTDAGNFASVFKLPSGFLGTPARFNNNANFAIPDSGSVTSSVNVAGITTPLQKLTVSLHLTHTTDEDLDISLIAPDGTTINLSTDNGGTGDDYGTDCADGSRVVFDDAAASSIVSATAPFVGSFRPEQQLSAFIGKQPFEVNGTWKLVVRDDAAGGVGTLRCWSLFISEIACAPGGGSCETCFGSVSGSITNGDAIQIGRLTRDGMFGSCDLPAVCPGVENNIPVNYDVHYFSNTSASAECVYVSMTVLDTVQCFSAAYLGNFSPFDLCANYLGDSAFSTTLSNTLTYSIVVPAQSVFAVTVNEIDAGSGVAGYNLTVTGSECLPRLDISPAANNRVRLHWPTTAVGYQLEAKQTVTSTNWLSVTNDPFVSEGRYSVTNNPLNPTTRFYRLHKP
jgi:autotransporter-associated beta strand protein